MIIARNNIILYLLTVIQEQYITICWLLNFICRYIPLKQWAFDDSHSPKYQKFTTDRLPVILPFIKQDWQFLLEYYLWKYGKSVRPVQRRNGKSIPEDIVFPLCGAPHHYLYDNNGGNGQYLCKICGQTFVTGEVITSPFGSCVLIAGTPLSQKRTGSSSASTNASTLSAPSICIISPGLIKIIWTKTMAKINTSSITSTGSSPWISSAWT